MRGHTRGVGRTVAQRIVAIFGRRQRVVAARVRVIVRRLGRVRVCLAPAGNQRRKVEPLGRAAAHRLPRAPELAERRQCKPDGKDRRPAVHPRPRARAVSPSSQPLRIPAPVRAAQLAAILAPILDATLASKLDRAALQVDGHLRHLTHAPAHVLRCRRRTPPLLERGRVRGARRSPSGQAACAADRRASTLHHIGGGSASAHLAHPKREPPRRRRAVDRLNDELDERARLTGPIAVKPDGQQRDTAWRPVTRGRCGPDLLERRPHHARVCRCRHRRGAQSHRSRSGQLVHDL
eukprot:3730720-Prymnesium_polylepis.1